MSSADYYKWFVAPFHTSKPTWESSCERIDRMPLAALDPMKVLATREKGYNTARYLPVYR